MKKTIFKTKNTMYTPYGIHKSIWNKYKSLIENNSYTSIMIKKEFNLNDVQIWFLFDKLLQCKYDDRYKRMELVKEKLRVDDYVYCKEYGRGVITFICLNDELMTVKFENKELPVMCSVNGYTVNDNIKRKVTRL